MYVRNVKQMLRAADTSFDERRYGFGGILDLLRGAQRDGLLRLERDRQGVLRVFAGTALQRPSSAPPVEDATTGESMPPGGCEDQSLPLQGSEPVAPAESERSLESGQLPAAEAGPESVATAQAGSATERV